MNIFAVRPCASPSPVRSGSWRPRWIPRGPPSKTLEILAFLRGRHWNSTCGINVQNDDPTNSIQILPIQKYAYKTSKNGGLGMVPGGPRQR